MHAKGQGELSERRYVVELTKPVPSSRLPAASQEIARRLGLEVARVVTLLKDRVGPVTKPVLATKADAIAAVFQEAGVDVAIYDAAVYQTDWGSAPATPVPSDEPARLVTPRPEPQADEPERAVPTRDEPERDEPARVVTPRPEPQADEPPEPPPASRVHAYGPVTPVPELDAWDVDDPWGGLDPWRASGLGVGRTEEADDVTVVEVGDREDRGGPRSVREEPRAALVDGVSAPSRGPEPGGGSEPAEAPEPDGATEPDGAAGTDDATEPDGRSGPEEAPAPDGPVGTDDARDLPMAVRQTVDELPLPPADRAVTVRPGVWDEGLPPGGRRPLRAILLVALGVALALFVALQLAYGGRGPAGASYEEGLAAYRTGDFAAARRTWERAAASGSERAEYMLGYLAQHGLGRPWSFREAAERYAAAAEAGLPEAQLALGEMYLGGLGVQPDAVVGAAWVERAAAAGYGPALYRLGELWFHGVGLAQDFDAALAAFGAAAERGSDRAADFMALAEHLRGANVSAP